MKDLFLVFLNKYKYHFLIWSIFIAYELILQRVMGTRLSSLKECIIAYSTGASIFYFHAHVLLKYTLNSKKKFIKYSLPLFILLELTFYIVIRYLIEEHLYKHIGVQGFALNASFKPYIGFKLWRCIYFIGTSTVYYFLIHDLRQNHQIEKLKQQELKTILLEKEIRDELILKQNALLRAQINPHFLINTLSYLYNETRKSAPKVADSILSLSDIMQYTLSKDVSSGYVGLKNEIKLAESFLILQHARQSYKTQLQLSYDNECLSVSFIPMILISLIENMIKYGQLDNSLKPAEIKINYENSILRIYTLNQQTINSNIPSHGIGLKNIRERLFLAYGEKVSFNYHLDAYSYFHTCIEVQA